MRGAGRTALVPANLPYIYARTTAKWRRTEREKKGRLKEYTRYNEIRRNETNVVGYPVTARSRLDSDKKDNRL